MPIAAFISLFTGIVIALLASYSLGNAAVPLFFVGTSAEKAITMELAPVLTGPRPCGSPRTRLSC